MPFLDGIPCSIHGIVLPDGVAVFRPVEMVTLRRGREFVYAGCATYWDPPDEVREQMRSIARSRSTARRRRRLPRCVHRGRCGDRRGFWPTELNPRFGAGLNAIARASGAPILLVNDLVVGGHDLGRPAAEIEARTARTGRRPPGRWHLDRRSHPRRRAQHTTASRATRRKVALERCGTGHIASSGASTGAEVAGTVTIGPSFVRVLYEPEHTPVGPSTAPRACGFWRFVGTGNSARSSVR
jgi:hypothetical protein